MSGYTPKRNKNGEYMINPFENIKLNECYNVRGRCALSKADSMFLLKIEALKNLAFMESINPANNNAEIESLFYAFLDKALRISKTELREKLLTIGRKLYKRPFWAETNISVKINLKDGSGEITFGIITNIDGLKYTKYNTKHKHTHTYILGDKYDFSADYETRKAIHNLPDNAKYIPDNELKLLLSFLSDVDFISEKTTDSESPEIRITPYIKPNKPINVGNSKVTNALFFVDSSQIANITPFKDNDGNMVQTLQFSKDVALNIIGGDYNVIKKNDVIIYKLLTMFTGWMFDDIGTPDRDGYYVKIKPSDITKLNGMYPDDFQSHIIPAVKILSRNIEYSINNTFCKYINKYRYESTELKQSYLEIWFSYEYVDHVVKGKPQYRKFNKFIQRLPLKPATRYWLAVALDVMPVINAKNEKRKQTQSVKDLLKKGKYKTVQWCKEHGRKSTREQIVLPLIKDLSYLLNNGYLGSEDNPDNTNILTKIEFVKDTNGARVDRSILKKINLTKPEESTITLAEIESLFVTYEFNEHGYN